MTHLIDIHHWEHHGSNVSCFPRKTKGEIISQVSLSWHTPPTRLLCRKTPAPNSAGWSALTADFFLAFARTCKPEVNGSLAVLHVTHLSWGVFNKTENTERANFPQKHPRKGYCQQSCVPQNVLEVGNVWAAFTTRASLRGGPPMCQPSPEGFGDMTIFNPPCSHLQ